MFPRRPRHPCHFAFEVGPFLSGQDILECGLLPVRRTRKRSVGNFDAKSGLSDINRVEIADLVRPDTDCVEGCAAPSLSLQDGGRMVLSRPLAWRRERRGSSTMHPHGCCWSSTLTHEDVQGCSGTFHPYAHSLSQRNGGKCPMRRLRARGRRLLLLSRESPPPVLNPLEPGALYNFC